MGGGGGGGREEGGGLYMFVHGVSVCVCDYACE